MRSRLDLLITQRGLAPSREQARRLIEAGQVTVNGQVAAKPGAQVAGEAAIEVLARPRFVSRGGEKLDAALERFGLDVAGLTCADVGASTGGFTDCLLQRGAAKVYAIDVGHDVLAESLRADPRVVVMEKANARYLEHFPEPVHFVTIDASFISLRLLLPAAKGWLASFPTSGASPLSRLAQPGEGGRGVRGILALIKPQFEAGKGQLGKGGVVRDPAVHRRVLEEIAQFAAGEGLALRGLMASPITGPKGNVEFLAWFAASGAIAPILAIDEALRERQG